MSEPYTIGKLTRRRGDRTEYWSYCIKWYQDGHRRRCSLGTTNAAEAGALARSFWATLTTGAVTTVGPAVEAYLGSLTGARDTARKVDGWKAASPFWETLDPSLIDLQTSHEYLAWRGKATNTMRNELSLLRTGLRWAEAKGMIDKAPPIYVAHMDLHDPWFKENGA